MECVSQADLRRVEDYEVVEAQVWHIQTGRLFLKVRVALKPTCVEEKSLICINGVLVERESFLRAFEIPKSINRRLLLANSVDRMSKERCCSALEWLRLELLVHFAESSLRKEDHPLHSLLLVTGSCCDALVSGFGEAVSQVDAFAKHKTCFRRLFSGQSQSFSQAGCQTRGLASVPEQKFVAQSLLKRCISDFLGHLFNFEDMSYLNFQVLVRIRVSVLHTTQNHV